MRCTASRAPQADVAAASVAPTDLSIVVVTWQSAGDVPDLLASLAPALAGGAELVVVDNASRDDTVATVRAGVPDARLIDNPMNRGFAAAANQGWAASRRPFVLFLNPDAVVAPDAIANALALLARLPAFALVGCRTLNEDGTLQSTVDRFHSVRGLLAESLGRRRRAGTPRGTSPATSGPVDWVYGSFLLARRDALAAVGGFDEAYEMYGEDLDLCHRLRAAGREIGYCAEATIVHRGNRSGAQRYGAERDVAVLQGTLRFFRRRRGRLPTLAFRAVAGTSFALKAWCAEDAATARRYVAMARLCATGDPAGRRADRARLRTPRAPGIEGP